VAADLRLLLFNLAVDETHPALGFASAWITALAERVAHVEVITMLEGPADLPDNVVVRSVGKERGWGEARRTVEFYRHLRAASAGGVDVCFSHMMPLFTVMGGPLLRMRGVPIVTWFAHPKLTRQLKLAHRLSDRMVTSVAEAYPYRRDKLIVVGQGIDITRFAPAPERVADPPLVLYTGRLSPAKGVHTLLGAVRGAIDGGAPPFRVAVVGGPGVSSDEAYVDRLRAQRTDLGLDDVVNFHDPVPFAELPAWYQQASVFVNLTPTGFGDKVALEAMASAVPCLTSNDGYRETVGDHAERLLYPAGDEVALGDRLGGLLRMTTAERAAIGADLRAKVTELHNIEVLADRLVELFADLRSERRRGRRSARRAS
jgi:glycosyltransferase involved in cell wall biosynthesis